VRGQSFELGAVDDEELPAWSEDEEEEGQSSTSARATNKGEELTNTANGEASNSLGADIVRPRSQAGRRGSNVKESSTSAA
jgi:hypothetical protein